MPADDRLSSSRRDSGETAKPVYDMGRCGRVTDHDDSIGGEGEITCGAVMMGDALTAECTRGHRWVACSCGGRTCKGWKVRP